VIYGGRAAALALLLTSFIWSAAPVQAGGLQCVAYARMISAVQLSGNAHAWWDRASGIYGRGQQPEVGAVLAFRSSRSMPAGHVAVVSKVLNEREVLLDHANWSYRGGIEKDVLAVDVSPQGDWSDVRVWHGPSGKLGIRSNPAYGFIYPQTVSPAGGMVLADAKSAQPAVEQLSSTTTKREKFEPEEMRQSARDNLSTIIK
jgi:hypothetical protein